MITAWMLETQVRTLPRRGRQKDLKDRGHSRESYVKRSRRGSVAATQPVSQRAEAAIGLAIALSQRILAEEDDVDSDPRAVWVSAWGLAGHTVGIFGMGRLGQSIAARLAAFETDVIYSDAQRAPLALEARLRIWHVSRNDLLESAEYLILTESAGLEPLIDRRSLLQMRSNACIVNVAGNAAVDLHAVCDALNGRLLKGYAADMPPETAAIAPQVRRPRLRAYFLAPVAVKR
jgi:lactate dehydrogenase-like 2-hydroxyacid dehydrogenase